MTGGWAYLELTVFHDQVLQMVKSGDGAPADIAEAVRVFQLVFREADFDRMTAPQLAVVRDCASFVAEVSSAVEISSRIPWQNVKSRLDELARNRQNATQGMNDVRWPYQITDGPVS